MNIIIISRERANYLINRNRRNSLKTLAKLNPELYIRNDDTQLNTYTKYAIDNNCKYTIYDAVNIHNYGQTADFIIDEYINKGIDKIAIIDDDLDFQIHKEYKYRIALISEIEKAFHACFNLLSYEIPFITYMPITKRDRLIINFCAPVTTISFLYMPFFKSNKQFRFYENDDTEAYCDFNLSLKLLMEGYLTCAISSLFISQNFNAPGGCSLYRSFDQEEKAIDALLYRYKEFITIKYRKIKWKNEYVIRRVPTVYWKRAFNKEKFKQRFNIDANLFCTNLLRNFEELYNA